MDIIFAELWGAIQNPRRTENQQATWILEAMWRAMYERVMLCRDPVRDQTGIRTLGRRIQTILNGDREWRAAEAGAEVKYLLSYDPHPVKEA